MKCGRTMKIFLVKTFLLPIKSFSFDNYTLIMSHKISFSRINAGHFLSNLFILFVSVKGAWKFQLFYGGEGCDEKKLIINTAATQNHPHLSQGRHKKDIVPLFREEKKKVLGLAAEDRLDSRASLWWIFKNIF